jgi:hypothetical protein
MEAQDLMIPIGKSNGDYSELKITLRSIERHFKNLGNIYIVGARPRWIKGVIYIECDDPYTNNKDANIIRKVLKVCDYPISQEFIRQSDDQIWIKDIEKVTIGHNGKIIAKASENRKWVDRLWRTSEEMKKLKLCYYNYDIHAPLPVDKDKFKETFKKFDLKKGYTINSLYFNYNLKEHKEIDKNIVLSMRHYKKIHEDKLKETMKGYSFLEHNPNGWKAIEPILYKLFPVKSKFER